MVMKQTTPTSSLSSSSTEKAANALSQWPKLQLPSSSFSAPLMGTTAAMNYQALHVKEITARRDLSGADGPLTGATFETHDVQVLDARHVTSSPVSLDTHGFQLWKNDNDNDDWEDAPTKDVLKKIDFLNQDSVVETYYPLCESLLKRVTGAAIVKAFDHNVRSASRAGTKVNHNNKNKDKDNDKTTTTTTTETAIQQPAGLVHNDYTRTSAPRRLQQLAQPPKANDVKAHSLLSPELVQQALDGKRRYAFLNVWRNINADEPVLTVPLACADASVSNAMQDFVVFKIVYKDRVGENYFVKYSKNHRWMFYDKMDMEECLLLKQWDSWGGIARGLESDSADGEQGRMMSTFAFHSAFMDPKSPKGASPRESIEVRCVLLWDEEEKEEGLNE